MERRLNNIQRVSRIYPEFNRVFSPFLFAESTLTTKRSRVILFAFYCMSTGLVLSRADHELVDLLPELSAVTPAQLLLTLRDWLIVLASAHMQTQSIRNYGESNFSLFQYVVPHFHSVSYTWNHVWANALRISRQNELQQAPVLLVPIFRMFSWTSRLVLLLLLQTSWRFHSLTKPIAVLKEYICPRANMLAAAFRVSAVKYIPNEEGPRKSVWCNCCTEYNMEFCFLHTFQDLTRRGLITPGQAVVTNESVALLKYELSKYGLTTHSAHVTAAVAVKKALRQGAQADVTEINIFNNWSTSATNLFGMYTRWYNKCDESKTIPLTSAFLGFLTSRRASN